MRDSEIAQAKTAVRLLSGYMEEREIMISAPKAEPSFSNKLDASAGHPGTS